MTTSNQHKRHRQRFFPHAIAAAVWGLAGLSPLHAAEKSTAELEAEVARWKSAYERLLQQTGAANPSSVATPSPTTASATVAPSTNAKPAEEESRLGAVVVNAGRIESPLEALKEVPKSISIVDGDELDRLGAKDVTEILKRVGNVQWNYGNPKTGSLAIRGISSGSSESIDPSLGVTVDNVPYAYVALASGSDFVDIESVEVSRGPQGFDGGRATTMGTINFKTRRPTFFPEAAASITLGERNALLTQGAIGGAVVPGLLAWRGTFYRNQQEGAFLNNYKDIEDRTTYGNTDRTYARLQFLLTPTPNFEALISVDSKPKGIEFVNGLSVRNAYPTPYYANGANYNDVASNGVATKLGRAYFLQAGSYTYADYLKDPINEDQNKGILNGNKGFSANLTWTRDKHVITSTTAWRNNFFQATNDEGTPFDISKNGGLFVHYDQLSQELKVASKPGGEVDYVAGLYYGHTASDAASRARYGSDAGAWFATQAQYLILDPVLPSNLTAPGRALLKDSIDRLRKQTLTLTDNITAAVYGKLDWQLDKALNLPLTLGAGVRLTKEDRRTSAGNQVTEEGFGADLNPGTANGFNSSATGALTTNTAAQLIIADRVAQRYYGLTYSALSAAQRLQIATAKTLRAAQRGATGPLVEASPFQDTIPTGVLSLTYKKDDNLSFYGTYQRGGKPGIAQLGTVVEATNVRAETTNAFELGLRSSNKDKTLVVNADVYVQYLNDFQTAINVEDTSKPLTTPPTYTSVTGNLPQVTIQGLELDANYTGLRNTSLRFAGAYNDARYSKSVFLAGPEENGNVTPNVFDANGYTLPNAPKWSYNVSGQHTLPLNQTHKLHADFNWNWKDGFNSTVGQSVYSWVPAYGSLDLGLGYGKSDSSFDITLLLKNALDSSSKTSPTATSYVPTNPRWIGVKVSAKL